MAAMVAIVLARNRGLHTLLISSIYSYTGVLRHKVHKVGMQGGSNIYLEELPGRVKLLHLSESVQEMQGPRSQPGS